LIGEDELPTDTTIKLLKDETSRWTKRGVIQLGFLYGSGTFVSTVYGSILGQGLRLIWERDWTWD